MERTSTIARAAAGIGSLLVGAVVLTGCAIAGATPAATDAPTPPPASAPTDPAGPTADPQPSPIDEETDAPVLPEADDDTTVTTHEDAWTFTSHDGAMRVDLPGGWTAAETVLGEHVPGEQTLGTTFVTFLSPTGTRLECSDRSGDDAAIEFLQREEVEQRSTPTGQTALAWWGETEMGVRAYVSLTEHRTDRSFSMWLADVPEVDSAAAAREFLARPEVQEALGVMATVELEP